MDFRGPVPLEVIALIVYVEVSDWLLTVQRNLFGLTFPYEVYDDSGVVETLLNPGGVVARVDADFVTLLAQEPDGILSSW